MDPILSWEKRKQRVLNLALNESVLHPSGILFTDSQHSHNEYGLFIRRICGFSTCFFSALVDH